jgi:putative addiction module component (TIGR02574 family)
MSLAEIMQMTVAERMELMEKIWESLRLDEEELPIPDWHREILSERLKRMEEGMVETFSIEEVRRKLKSS